RAVTPTYHQALSSVTVSPHHCHVILTVVPRKGSCLEIVYWYRNWLYMYTLGKVLYLAHLKRAVVWRQPIPHSRQG
ncbi:MAG: hypothetical protein ACPIOQ_76440, partial [Promethearchaeia archaeon]